MIRPRAATRADGVAAILREYGTATLELLEAYLPNRSAFREEVGDYPRRPGFRMLRASLCIAAARAWGGRQEDVLHSATAVELFHSSMRVLDDLEDGSEQRWGRPALHRRHGVPLALHLGDTLTVLSLRPLIDNREVIGPLLAMRVVEETFHMAHQFYEGQALDLGWRRDNVLDLSDGDYLAMVLKKTCWPTIIQPVRVGALIAGGGEIDRQRFVRFGFFLGAALQIEDDLAGLAGDPGRHGCDDLWEGKRTLPLLRLWRLAGVRERQQLSDLLATPRRLRRLDDVLWIRERLEARGCPDYARQVGLGLAASALGELEHEWRDAPPSRDKGFVEDLILGVQERLTAS